jgi:dipeptidyl aminopeptidase/acylaminoacyl peptidase
MLLSMLMWVGVCGCIPLASAVSPRQLVEVVDIGPPVVSPDGRLVAFRTEQASVERNTYDTAWYVQPFDGSAPARRVADGGIPLRDAAGTAVPMPATWSPDGRWIYYRALVGGRIDVWRAEADGSGAQPLTRDAANVRDFVLSTDGRFLRYRVGASREAVMAAEQAEYDQGVRIDASVPLGQGVFRSSNLEGRLATQRYTGNWFDRDALLADVPLHWKLVDLKTRAVRDLAAADVPPASPGPSDFAAGTGEQPWRLAVEPRTGRIALLTRIGEGDGLAQKPEVRLSVLVHPRARQSIRCTAELCTGKAITALQWRPGSDEVLFTITEPTQAQTIARWNVGSGEVRPVARSVGLMSGGRDAYTTCGVSVAALACAAAEAGRPPRLERIDLADGARQVLFDPNALLAQEIARTLAVRPLHWQDGNGQQYTGQFFLARSLDGQPPPLFVTYYSCPGFLRGGVGDEWPLAPLASQGIATLCINQVPRFSQDAVARYGDGLSAVASAVDVLAVAGEVDRNRVGMGGLSFGSEVTFWALMHSELLAAASVSSPMPSPLYYLMGSLKGEDFTSEMRRLWQVESAGAPWEQWQRLSPALNLDAIRAPLLMQMPEQEYLYALDYAVPLLRAGRADLYVFPNEPHQKFQPRHKLAVYERNLDWFRFWLMGVEDTDAAKAAQYDHWRRMRERAVAPSADAAAHTGD